MSLLLVVVMRFGRDAKNQDYVEWEIGSGGWKRAWVQDRSSLGPEKDWANTGRHLNVVRIERPGAGPAGSPTDFPIYSKMPNRQLLQTFVLAISAITGTDLPDSLASN